MQYSPRDRIAQALMQQSGGSQGITDALNNIANPPGGGNNMMPQMPVQGVAMPQMPGQPPGGVQMPQMPQMPQAAPQMAPPGQPPGGMMSPLGG